MSRHSLADITPSDISPLRHTHLRELRVLYQARLDGQGRPIVIGHARSQAHFVAVLTKILADEPNEVLGMLCLSTRQHVIACHEISRGSLDGTRASPRDIFKAALLANAAAIVLGHNHPSGDPTPSASDIAMTRRLAQVGRLIGVDVIDHLIVSSGRYASLQEHCRPSTTPLQCDYIRPSISGEESSASVPERADTGDGLTASHNARDNPPLSTDAFLNFERMLEHLLSVPHSIVAEHGDVHQVGSAKHPRRAGPGPKPGL